MGVPKAVAGLLREVTRYTAQVLMPPGWDERYITVFGSSYDEVGVEGVTSMTTWRQARRSCEQRAKRRLQAAERVGAEQPQGDEKLPAKTI